MTRNDILEEAAQAVVRMNPRGTDINGGTAKFIVYDYQFAIAEYIRSMKDTTGEVK